MSYYFAKKLEIPFEEAIDRVTEELKTEGFGVLTEIDVKATLEKKLGVGFRNYRILGACNPPFAHRALLAEDKIGTMLPCNVIVQELPDGGVEVAAVDPLASMQAVETPDIAGIAHEVQAKLEKVVANLQVLCSGKRSPGAGGLYLHRDTPCQHLSLALCGAREIGSPS